jgi:hypothetical protein
MIVKNVTVTQDFSDGDLADVFVRLGYPGTWKRGERRDLPQDVIQRVTRSGGVITFAEEGAKESAIVVGAEPQKLDAKPYYEGVFKKAPKRRVLFPEGFRDGTLTDECAALGRPPEFGVGEIAELPVKLIDKIKASGGMMETNPEAIAQFEHQQGKHLQKIKDYQEAKKRADEFTKKAHEAQEHNKSALAEIEELSARVISTTGKTKEALWQRINELQKSMK